MLAIATRWNILLAALSGPLLAQAGTALLQKAVRAATGRASALPVAGSVVGGRPVGLVFVSRYLIAMHSLKKAIRSASAAGPRPWPAT